MKQTASDAERLRTWHHLSGARRKPSEYEITSVDYWYPTNHAGSGQPFQAIAKTEPVNQWYARWQDGTALRHSDWHAFRDPDEVIYRGYTALQDGQEQYVEGVLDRFDEEGHDLLLPENWVRTLARLYAPSRFLLHTVQMLSAYACSMSPTSTVGLVHSYQAGDALRWVSRVAYRTAELRDKRPGFGFGERERALWEQDPAWQGFRELMERLLVAYDFGETAIVLALVAKPAVDECLVTQFGRAARSAGDTVAAMLADAQRKDVERSRRWTTAFARFVLREPGNAPVIADWIARWTPLADAAIDAWCAALPDGAALAATARAATRAFRDETLAPPA